MYRVFAGVWRFNYAPKNECFETLLGFTTYCKVPSVGKNSQPGKPGTSSQVDVSFFGCPSQLPAHSRIQRTRVPYARGQPITAYYRAHLLSFCIPLRYRDTPFTLETASGLFFRRPRCPLNTKSAHPQHATIARVLIWEDWAGCSSQPSRHSRTAGVNGEF